MTRLFPRLLIVSLCVLSYATAAHADTYTVTEPTDYWFSFREPTLFEIRTYSTTDPFLWLYDDTDRLVTYNDDYYGLDSRLSIELPAGTYRLHAGVCCWNPAAWYGSSYQLSTQMIMTPPTTSTTTTTTEPSTTTTTTTSTLPETTTTEVTTTWVPNTTSTIPEQTTTTTAPTTTAPATTTTSTTTPPPTSSTSTSDAPPTSALNLSAPAPTAPATTAPPVSTTIPATTTQPPIPSTTVAPTTPPTTVPEPDPTSPPDPSISPSDSLPAPQVTEPPSDASDAVKAEFEAAVNIFDGTHDDYVPVGSTISVAERRTLTTVSVTMGVIPIGAPRRRK